MWKMTISLVFAAALAGCVTKDVDVQAVRPWEGRYESLKDAQQAVLQVDFKKDKSVWILSPDTLRRAVLSAQGDK